MSPIPPIDGFMPEDYLPPVALMASGRVSEPISSRQAAMPAGKPDDFEAGFQQLSLGEMTALLNSINRRGVTYTDLLRYYRSTSDPVARRFLEYLIRDIGFFNRLAGLEDERAILTPKDLETAAALAGDAQQLEAADLILLMQPPQASQTVPIAPVPRRASFVLESPLSPGKDELPKLTEDIRRPVLNRRQDEGEATPVMNAGKARPNVSLDKEEPSAPQAPAWDRSGLLWHPDGYRYLPLQPLPFPPARQTSRVAGANAVTGAGKAMPPEPFHFQTLEISAARLAELLDSLGEQEAVSLDMLRHLRPKKEQEKQLLNMLRQRRIFSAISQLDGNGHMLSDEDIQRAKKKGVLLLTQPNIRLVIEE